MLQRPRGLDHNQENPHSLAGPSHHINNNSKLDHKTPARSLVQGKGGAAPVTGGKGGPSTVGRGVLGRKDGNQGKGGSGSGGTGKDSALLFPSKPSTSQSTAPTQSFKTPAPKPRSLRPLADLQTPATALRPKRAPVLVPSPEAEQEIEVEVEEDVQQEVRNLGDREVEYAGGSSADYEEPYEPPQPEPDYKTMGYGDILRGMSFHGTETAEEWEAKDAILRREEKFTLDEVLTTDLDSDLVEDPLKPLFPVPASLTSATRRAPLASKPSNSALSSSVRSSAMPPPRRPLTTTTSTLRRPALQPSLSAPISATRRALASSTTIKPSSTPLSRSITASNSSRPPLKPSAPSFSRPASSLSQSSASTRSRPPLLASSSRKPSFASRPTAEQLKLQEMKKKRERLEHEEEKLGAFGLAGGGVGEMIEAAGGIEEGAFRFGDEEQQDEGFELDLGFD